MYLFHAVCLNFYTIYFIFLDGKIYKLKYKTIQCYAQM
jgi:hypothetical protein